MKPLRQLLAAVALTGLVAASAPASLQAQDKPGPKIEFRETTHDFGTFRKADRKHLEHSFVLRNTGTAPLVISTVSAGCQCTKKEFDPRPIAPGDSSVITLRLESKDVTGEFTKQATVYTNVKGRGRNVTLRLRGVALPSNK